MNGKTTKHLVYNLSNNSYPLKGTNNLLYFNFMHTKMLVNVCKSKRIKQLAIVYTLARFKFPLTCLVVISQVIKADKS